MKPTKIVPGCEIICQKLVTENFRLQGKQRCLLMGTVYTPYGLPLPFAAVEVSIITDRGNMGTAKVLGITFTEADGTYAISIPIIGMDYIITAYSP